MQTLNGRVSCSAKGCVVLSLQFVKDRLRRIKALVANNVDIIVVYAVRYVGLQYSAVDIVTRPRAGRSEFRFSVWARVLSLL